MTSDTQNPALTPEQVAEISREAMKPRTSKDSVTLLGKEIPIRFMPVAKEERVMDLVEPYVPLIMGMAKDDLSGFTKLLRRAHRDLPKAVAIIAEPHLSLEEIEAEASTPELMAVVTAQLEKYGMQDLLGKPSMLSGLFGSRGAEQA